MKVEIDGKVYVPEVEKPKEKPKTAGEKWAQKLGPWDGKSSTACPIRREKGASICNGITCAAAAYDIALANLPSAEKWWDTYCISNRYPFRIDIAAASIAVADYIKMAKGAKR